MKKISNVLFLSILGAATLTSCQNDDKESKEKEEVRGINLAYMDTTVSAQEDFFRYVNGKWVDSTEIPSDQTTWGSFMEDWKKGSKQISKSVQQNSQISPTKFKSESKKCKSRLRKLSKDAAQRCTLVVFLFEEVGTVRKS